MDDLEKNSGLEEKMIIFVTALSNVYAPKEERESFESLKWGQDINEDLTAMLLAMQFIATDACSGIKDYDVVDFTHLLNKLAVQSLLESNPTIETKII